MTSTGCSGLFAGDVVSFSQDGLAAVIESALFVACGDLSLVDKWNIGEYY